MRRLRQRAGPVLGVGVRRLCAGAPPAQRHVSVLRSEVVAAFADALPADGAVTVVDGTVGAGGHASALLERLGGRARLIGFDRDASALELAAQRPDLRVALTEGRLELRHGNFADMGTLLEAHSADGLLLDLGVSSMQLDVAERGFSYRRHGPLDMRMDTSRGDSAETLVNEAPEKVLGEVLRQLGEVRQWRRVATAIVRARSVERITTTKQLVAAVAPLLNWKQAKRRHPAATIFQALRMAVNDELAALRGCLLGAPAVLKPGALAAVISFHSLEDGVVKRAFKDEASWVRLARRQVPKPSREEVNANPRARSAKLRFGVRCPL